MKIMMLNDFWEFSGGEMVFRWLIEGLLERGHKVLGLTSQELKGRSFESYLREFRPDVIHQHNFAYLGPVALREMKRRPGVQTIHDYWPICPSRHHFFFKEDRICDHGRGKPVSCIGCPDYLAKMPFPSAAIQAMEGITKVAVSEYVARKLMQYGYEDVEWIHNGIRLQEDGRSEDGGFILGMGSRPDQVKGVRQFGEMVKGLPYNVVMVGGSGEIHLEGVQQTGRIPYAQAMNYYRTCSVMVIPSVWEEPNGLGIQEASQFGKPILAFHVGGIPEYLEHDTIPLRDIAAAREHLVFLMENPEERQRRGERNRKKLLENFTVEKMTEKYEALYERIAR